MIYQTFPVNEYLKLLMTKLMKLFPHSFIAKQQSNSFRNHKQFLETGTVICLMGFSENYTFDIQDEAQGRHWTHDTYTVHLVVCYYNSINGYLHHCSLCFLSNDLNHDVSWCIKYKKKQSAF